MKNNTPSNSNKLIDLKDLMFVWSMFRKNLHFLILVPILAYLVGYVYTHRLANVYGAKVQLLLKSNETYDYQDPIYKGLGAYGVYMDVQNQMRILRSRDLVGEVVDKVKVNTSYYVVGKLKKKEVFETLPFRSDVEVINAGIYEVPINVQILNVEEYQISYTIGDQNFIYIHKFGEDLITDYFYLTLSKRYIFNEDNIQIITSSEYEIVFHSRDYLISKYQSSLGVENIEHTSVLEVSIIDELEPRAKIFLDTLTQIYIDFSMRTQLSVNQNTLDNIDRQIDTVSSFLRLKEQEMLAFRDQNAVLDPSKEGTEYFAEYVIYTRRKREIERKKNSVIALKKYLESSVDERILPPSFYIEQNDFYLREAVSEVRSLQVDLEIQRSHSKEVNPTLVLEKKKIAMLKKDIISYIVNLMGAMDGEIEHTQEMIDKYRANITVLPRTELGVSNIQRELDVNNKMYLFLLEKKTNTLIARAGIIPQVQVIETAVNTGIVRPDKAKILRLFVLGGFVLALLIAFIRKVFFERIENLKSLADTTNLAVIGGIPYLKNIDRDIVVEENPKAQVTESFRTIRSNISFLEKEGEGAKKILISSFFPGEGKTFCSTNLSAMLAKTDKKVLIMDFDLHRPKVHKAFKIENSKGVSNYIIGKASFEELIKKNVLDGLDVITAGPISPNPSEMVIRDKVDELIAEAEKSYDYLIIDTPPFGLLNDTFELAKKSEMLVVILNTKYTRRRGISHIESILDKYEGINIGVVLNGVKESRLQYFYNKYSYSYTYGNSYGYSAYSHPYDEDEEDSK